MPMSNQPKSFAVVDDDEDVRNALKRLLTAFGHDVTLYSSAEDVLTRGDVEADCLLVDLSLPAINGLQLAERLRSSGCRLPIVLMTAYDEAATHQAAARAGLPVLRKPFDEAELHAAVARARTGAGR